jgi:hypothetical protein
MGGWGKGGDSSVSTLDLWLALGAWSALVVVMSAIVIGSLVITPEALMGGRASFVPTCPTRAWFGRECPTCGTTRAFAALGHGRVREALGYNRGAPISYAFILACAAFGTVQTIQTVRQIQSACARRIE